MPLAISSLPLTISRHDLVLPKKIDIELRIRLRR